MAASLLFPPPPSVFKRFTDEALAAGTDPLLRPPPPLGSEVAAYTIFGETLRLQDTPPKLPDMGCEQLFADEDSPNFGINRSLSLVLVFIAFIASLPSDPWFATMPPSTEDRATELKKLNHSLLLNFLELQHILVNRPQDFTTKIEHIRILFINMHYLLNGYRPHQARDTLKLLMELQIHRRISMAREIQQCLGEVDETLRGLFSPVMLNAVLDASRSEAASGAMEVDPVGMDGMDETLVKAEESISRPKEEVEEKDATVRAKAMHALVDEKSARYWAKKRALLVQLPK